MTVHLLEHAGQAFVPTAEVALVTLAVGERYLRGWQQVARQSWERYAERHGYDIVAIAHPLDTSPEAQARSVAWQKCLILSQPWSTAYRRIVWVDADIVINPAAPPIDAAVPPGRVGGTLNYAQHSPAEHHIRLERTPEGLRPPLDRAALAASLDAVETAWDDYHRFIYRQFEQLDTPATRIVQTGVLVLEPGPHRALLERAYAHVQRTRCYEQHPLSAILLDEGWLHPISPRYNWIFYEACALYYPPLLDASGEVPWELFQLAFNVQFHNNAWFLHFAGMEKLFERIVGLRFG